jgi:hypothetical protein
MSYLEITLLVVFAPIWIMALGVVVTIPVLAVVGIWMSFIGSIQDLVLMWRKK